MSIRSQTLMFIRFAILALLAVFSAGSYAGFKINSTSTFPVNASACFLTQVDACNAGCASRTSGNPPYTHTGLYNGQCQCRSSTNVLVAGPTTASCNEACPAGQVRNPQTGLCETPAAEPCDWPKTGTKPNCSCPPAGTNLGTPISYNPAGSGDTPVYCDKINVGGCFFESCSRNNKDVPIKDGKPCVAKPDGTTECYTDPVSSGDSVPDDCGNNCGNPATPVTEPKQTEPPTTSESTETNPTTGETKQTSSTTETKVNPDGSTTKTTTETTVSNSGGQTTTTTKTTTTNRGSNGTTTTTTRTDVTDGNGNTTTTYEGTSTDPGGEAAEGKGEGECDPTKANYMDCVGLTEEIGDGDAQEIIDGVKDGGDEGLNDWKESVDDLIDSKRTVDEPSALENLVNSFIPDNGSCSDLTMSFKGHTMRIDCSDFQPLKAWLGWLLAILTVLGIFYVALRPQTT